MSYPFKVRLIYFLLTIGNKIFKVGIPPIPSVSAVIIKNQKILVIKLTYHDGYALPGGVLKGNESFTDALKREIKEETGLKVESTKYIDTYCSTDPYPKVVISYLVSIQGKLGDSHEGTSHWFKPEKVFNQLVYDDNKQVIKDYFKL